MYIYKRINCVSKVRSLPGWKKNSSDQAPSFPRDWRLSASWGPTERPPEPPPQHHGTMVVRGSRGPSMRPHYAEG